MSDFFFSKLPVGHAIRTMTRTSASASLLQESAMGTGVASSADAARQQCAAMAWVLSDVYSVTAVRKLPQAARAYLLQLFGIDPSPHTPALQAARIEAHRALHHPELAGDNDNVSVANRPEEGGGNGGGGGGGGAASAGQPGDVTSGFAPALLPATQLAALHAVPVGEVWKLLDAAGVPHSPGNADFLLRAAAWAAEKLRTLDDVRALPDGIQDQMLACFDIPAARKPEARRHSLLMSLQSCRDSAWSVDPGLSFGLVNRDRSELFRLADRLTAPKPDARSTTNFYARAVSVTW
jgi:hypothetical protein